jgi:hypothetical protein
MCEKCFMVCWLYYYYFTFYFNIFQQPKYIPNTCHIHTSNINNSINILTFSYFIYDAKETHSHSEEKCFISFSSLSFSDVYNEDEKLFLNLITCLMGLVSDLRFAMYLSNNIQIEIKMLEK